MVRNVPGDLLLLAVDRYPRHGFKMVVVRAGKGSSARTARKSLSGVSWRTPASCGPEANGMETQGLWKRGFVRCALCQGNRLRSLCIPGSHGHQKEKADCAPADGLRQGGRSSWDLTNLVKSDWVHKGRTSWRRAGVSRFSRGSDPVSWNKKVSGRRLVR